MSGRRTAPSRAAPSWVLALAVALALILALPTSSRGEGPETPEALYSAGVEALRGGRVYEALELLGRVARQQSDYRDVQLLLGQACLVADLTRPAQQHFRTVLEADPANGHAAYLLGLTLFRSARYVEANAMLARAETLAPENPHPAITRGRTLLALGRPREARAEVEMALSMAPDEPSAWSAMAELDLEEGRLREAERRARDTLAAGGESAEGLLLLGRIVLTAGRAAEAVPLLRQAVALSPRRTDGLYLLSQALLRSGEPEEGQEILARFRERKQREEAIRVLESALARSPADLEARIQLVGLLIEHGELGSAGLQLSDLHRRAPGDPRFEALAEAIEGTR